MGRFFGKTLSEFRISLGTTYEDLLADKQQRLKKQREIEDKREKELGPPPKPEPPPRRPAWNERPRGSAGYLDGIRGADHGGGMTGPEVRYMEELDAWHSRDERKAIRREREDKEISENARMEFFKIKFRSAMQAIVSITAFAVGVALLFLGNADTQKLGFSTISFVMGYWIG